ncbi:Psp2p NDAI_0C00950 [Naumovozyma dairenensis CBS 421]|uniref:RRM domain-containing protein n=1 Tax=Naumovozyma dairenensis (strain ATCC 10597 / BCRC 20456 / CBS 421 / NBRC 0211 / NRRL Y-12639) TaxID=1071378 RepID=G0W7J5_NAUDC|nr:hypothetical protein NDAI_0C00950 [Naumovozyma dairenensis CBS 421]CCD23756.1 hypothetical protein NDAI_0C00950 [Naumovozyma dairenensis CBS 421]
MSLEEFLGDDSLGDSVWNEDEINLDAINNTTNIDVLKPTTTTMEQGFNGLSQNNTPGNFSRSPSSALNQPIPANHPGLGGHAVYRTYPDTSNQPQGPPYIIKFSNLPPKFSDYDIKDLFQAKYTKFVKFKLFWELNKKPTIAVLKSGSIFDQNFKHDSKVAFVELYTSRDMDKVRNNWVVPLKEIYQINTEPAHFDDFKEYIAKNTLLTDPKDDPSKPYVLPKPKPNPFGTAKPVDTQSKVLDIEEKMRHLHVEDTTTLRRLSQGDSNNNGNTRPKVTILKKEHKETTIPTEQTEHTPETEESKEQEKTKNIPKPLSYSQVLQRSVEDIKKGSVSPTAPNGLSSSSGNGGPLNERSSSSVENSQSSSTSSRENKTEQINEDNNTHNDDVDDDHDGKENMQDHNDGKPFVFKNSERETSADTTGSRPTTFTSPSSSSYDYKSNMRGGYRGGSSRGSYNRRGGRGRGGSYQSRNNTYNNSEQQSQQSQERNFNDNNDSNENNNNNNNNTNNGANEEKGQYSLFAPASGFLQSSDGSRTSSRGGGRGNLNTRRGGSGGSGRGSSRGGSGVRRGGRGGGGYNRGYRGGASNNDRFTTA